MGLVRTMEPAAEPVDAAELKAFCASTKASERPLSGLIRAARIEVEQATGLALIDQSWRLVAGRLAARRHGAAVAHPVRDVLAVTLLGAEGEARCRPGRLRARPGVAAGKAAFRTSAAGAVAAGATASRSSFQAGFGEAGTDVPDLLRRAMLDPGRALVRGARPDGQRGPAGRLPGRL